MASKGKERENFFRICILVVDHIKNALVEMFKYYLREYKEDMSFEKFIDEHMTDIRYLKKSKILYKDEVDKLIVGDKAISGLKVDVLEVTLVRRLLDNLCPDLFMGGCKALHDFLKKNQHDIYHLFKFNERCCQCSQDYKFPVTEELLKENQYNKMFELSPCTNCTGTNGTVCSGSSCIVTEDIKLDIKLNYKIKKVVFGHFSPIFKAMLKFTEIRNNAYGHADATVIPNVIYDVYKKDIEENIMVLARICGNEDETRLALDDVQTRSYDETLCKQYMISLSEQVKRDIELMEVTCENSQKLQELQESNQKIEKHLQKLTEEMGNMNLNKDVGVTVEAQTLQETNLLISTPSSGNQSSVIAISVKNQTNLHFQTQQHQLDRKSLEHQNLQTLDNDIPSTFTQPPILLIQNLMTNNIERNSLERDQQVAVVASGGLMRNSEPQNLHSSVNPTDDQAGALTSCSPESSSNNISTGNDQRGQGYQSSIGTDAEPYISSVNNERAHDSEKKRDIYDGVVLHAEDDRDAAIEFITNMESENPDLNINITLYESLFPGKPIFQSVAEIFDICRCLFVFVTQKFVEADLKVFLASIATLKIITSEEENDRLITVKASKNCNHHWLDQFQPLTYHHYLEAKKTQRRPDRFFIESFIQVITDRRQKYLK